MIVLMPTPGLQQGNKVFIDKTLFLDRIGRKEKYGFKPRILS